MLDLYPAANAEERQARIRCSFSATLATPTLTRILTRTLTRTPHPAPSHSPVTTPTPSSHLTLRSCYTTRDGRYGSDDDLRMQLRRQHSLAALSGKPSCPPILNNATSSSGEGAGSGPQVVDNADAEKVPASDGFPAKERPQRYSLRPELSHGHGRRGEKRSVNWTSAGLIAFGSFGSNAGQVRFSRPIPRSTATGICPTGRRSCAKRRPNLDHRLQPPTHRPPHPRLPSRLSFRRSFNRLHLSCRRQFSAGVQANGASPPLRWPSGLCSSSESRALSSLTCSLTTATIGALALTVGQLCFALVTNTTTGLNLLWLAIVFNAVSLAFNSVAVNPSLAECATPESMGSVIGFGGMSANAARIFGPICWGSLYRGAWRHTYYVSSIVGLLSAASYAPHSHMGSHPQPNRVRTLPSNLITC
jgi:hypothetical protein